MKNKRKLNSLTLLDKASMKKIVGGITQDPISLSSCSKDCGGGVSVSCSGSSCTTTDYGCYSQNSSGGIDIARC